MPFVLFGVLAIGTMVALVAINLRMQKAPIEPINTQQITKNQSIGGSETTDTPKKSNQHTQPALQVKQPRDTPQTPHVSRTSVITDSAPAPSDNSAAPGQGIAAAKEYPYKALTSPNDPYFTSTSYTPWALQSIKAPDAWNITTGSTTVVAVIDTGFALDHEDLKTQWYQNPGENGTTQLGDKCWTGTPQDKSNNNCDDDSNGYIDDWRGWNFYGRYQPTADPCAADGLGTYIANNNPMAGASGDNILYQEDVTCGGPNPGDAFAAVSHGTSTAGLAGAATNNGVGIASPNWNVKIMPLQALGDDGSGWTNDIVAAVKYAVNNGANVISMSLGGDSDDPALKSAISYAYSKNVIVIAAAGNCGTGTEGGCDPAKPGAMGYPALYDHVVSVGATDANDKRASFSSYGPGLDIVAPGSGSIVSPLVYRGTANRSDSATFNYTNSYSASLYGTSFSTPIVSGVASLIKSVHPTYTVDDVVALLDATARKPASMNGAVYTNEYGHGIVDAGSMAAVAQSFGSAAASSPTLLQTGGYKSEHTYTADEPMASGCVAATATYCTVHLKQTALGYDRYLPYVRTGADGKVGWQWRSAILTPSGEWTVTAMQSTAEKGNYPLFSK